jgi:cytochrome c556
MNCRRRPGAFDFLITEECIRWPTRAELPAGSRSEFTVSAWASSIVQPLDRPGSDVYHHRIKPSSVRGLLAVPPAPAGQGRFPFPQEFRVMSRKWAVLAVSMVSFGLLSAGLSIAADDESPLHPIMEKVNKASVTLKKNVRTPVNFKKAGNGKDVAADAETIVKLAKQARDIKDAAKKAKDVPNAVATWDELMDNLISSSEEVAKAASKGDYEASKAASKAMSSRCTACHEKFRIDEP